MSDSNQKGTFFKTQSDVTRFDSTPKPDKPNLAVGMKATKCKSSGIISKRLIERNFDQFKEGQLKHKQLVKFIQRSLESKNETEFKPDLSSIISPDLRKQLAMMLERIDNMDVDNQNLRQDCRVLEEELVRQKEMYQGQVEAYEVKTKEQKSAAKELHKIEQKNQTLKKEQEFLEEVDLQKISALTNRMKMEQRLNENSYSNKLDFYNQTQINLQRDNEDKKRKMQKELDSQDSAIKETKKRIDNQRTDLSTLKYTVEGQDQNRITEDIPEYNKLKNHLKNNFSSKNYAVQD